MDFLLECIGFPPNQNQDRLAEEAFRHGEQAAWRGPSGEHWRLALGGGLELRADREDGEPHWTLLPHFRTKTRLRVQVESLRTPPDSPGDVVLTGWTRPPIEDRAPGFRGRGTHRLAALLTDARRLPPSVPGGHVLAVALAGFALEVETQHRDELGGRFDMRPLLGPDDPGGCVELSARIRDIGRFENDLTGVPVHAIQVDGPGRPMTLFASPWQLFEDGLPPMRIGGRISGTFLLTGHVAGGLPSSRRRVGASFG